MFTLCVCVWEGGGRVRGSVVRWLWVYYLEINWYVVWFTLWPVGRTATGSIFTNHTSVKLAAAALSWLAIRVYRCVYA